MGYDVFFRNKKAGKKACPPKFRKVKKYRSMSFWQSGYLFLDDNCIVIQRKRYRYHKSRELEGNVKTVTVKRNQLGECFICVVTDAVAALSESRDDRNSVGVDFGLKHYLTLSDGDVIESPQFFQRSVKDIRKASMDLSSKKPGVELQIIQVRNNWILTNNLIAC